MEADTPSSAEQPGPRQVLRHLAATLAYRAAKVLREVPPDFRTAAFGSTTRRPVLIVAHLADLMAWAVTMAEGDVKWKAGGGNDWDAEVQRFFSGLATLDQLLLERTLADATVEQLIQGPLADSLTHVGQLAMLRGMAGHSVRPESYARAEITRGRVGLDQAPARREFEGDASVPKPKPAG